MPAELFTHTGTDVVNRVRSQFGDTSGAQLADAPILNWINDGQREIVNNNSILKDTKYANLVADQQDYSFPDDQVFAIEAIYVSGYPIQNISPQAAREYVLALDPTGMVKAEKPEVWYERAGIITFYPVPSTSIANAIKLEYVRTPAPLVAFTDTLSVPDRYFNELVNYVISQALEMDENYSGAAYKLGQFREGLDRLNLKDTLSQTDLYTQLMPDPDDYL
jgi:hypothetical protein